MPKCFCKLFLEMFVIVAIWEASSNGAKESCNKLVFNCNETYCIQRSSFCNGNAECPDGNDEVLYNSSIHGQGDGIGCQSRRSLSGLSCLLPKRYLCDHELDCEGGYDECGCNSTFNCEDGSCSLKVAYCNGETECLDGSDEFLYNKTGFQCPVTKNFNTLHCKLPDYHVCDGDSDCNWGIDECFCDFSSGKGKYLNNVYSNDRCFRCLDGSLVIPNNQVCDDIIHCKDLSDECLCDHSKKSTKIKGLCQDVCKAGGACDCPGQLQCTAKKSKQQICISSEQICNDKYDCDNGYDESFCALDTESFLCKDNVTKIRKKYVCDGLQHCPDDSDESFCEKEMFMCNTWKPPFCRNNASRCPSLKQLRAKFFSLPNTISFKYVWPHYATKCDGLALCSEMEDECDASVCPGKRPDSCTFLHKYGMRCPNSNSKIIGYEVCDGNPTCNDTAPETSADEFNCSDRFYCDNMGKTRLPIHIPISHRCNGRAECDDQSDEMNCNKENITHFYCNDGGSTKFIPIEQRCDKRKDCKEGSDECDNCKSDPFSSDENLIKSRVLIVFLWIIGIFSTIGNIAVMIHQTIMLIKPIGAPTPISVSNRIMVLNLAAADLLVGIYLIALGVKDASDERYCLQDGEWRSSSTCSSLGAIAVIGTETSVFILLIMTSYRLYLVVRPYKTQKTRILVMILVAAWIFAIVLGVVPLAGGTQEYFLSCVWYRTHSYLGYTCKDEIFEFTRNLQTFEGPRREFSKVLANGYNWYSVLDAQKLLNETFVPERYYGYYAAHSACLPRLFPDPKQDKSWGYSLFLILLNFFAFVFILSSYVYIYRRTTTTKVTKASAEDRTAALQRKISRIVMTDFFCWMPICIMAFVKVGGVDVGDIAYAVTAIILLPINSAMNPFLYSSLLDIIWEKMMPIRIWFNKTKIGQKLEKRREVKRNQHRKSSRSTATSVTSVPATNTVRYDAATEKLNP